MQWQTAVIHPIRVAKLREKEGVATAIEIHVFLKSLLVLKILVHFPHFPHWNIFHTAPAWLEGCSSRFDVAAQSLISLAAILCCDTFAHSAPSAMFSTTVEASFKVELSAT